MSTIPLNHHRIHEEWVFTSGQIGRDAHGDVPADFARQAELAIESLQTHLEAGGASTDTVIKTTVFLTRQEDFAVMNEIYAKYFSEPWPARSTVVVGMVRPEILFEIEAVAYRRP